MKGWYEKMSEDKFSKMASMEASEIAESFDKNEIENAIVFAYNKRDNLMREWSGMLGQWYIAERKTIQKTISNLTNALFLNRSSCTA